MELTRKQVIEELQKMLDYYTIRQDSTPEIKQALVYSIASLKTDDAYQIMYEGGEIYTKADVVNILSELQLKIEEREESIIGHYGKETKESDFPSHKIKRNNGRKECVDLIQQKIDNLKGKQDDR